MGLTHAQLREQARERLITDYVSGMDINEFRAKYDYYTPAYLGSIVRFHKERRAKNIAALRAFNK